VRPSNLERVTFAAGVGFLAGAFTSAIFQYPWLGVMLVAWFCSLLFALVECGRIWRERARRRNRLVSPGSNWDYYAKPGAARWK